MMKSSCNSYGPRIRQKRLWLITPSFFVKQSFPNFLQISAQYAKCEKKFQSVCSKKSGENVGEFNSCIVVDPSFFLRFPIFVVKLGHFLFNDFFLYIINTQA
jgi:hypothetical protein